MSRKRHAYIAFYPSDWDGGVTRLTRLQRSVYFDICKYCWDHASECPPDELEALLGDLSDWPDRVEKLIKQGKLYRKKDSSVGNKRAVTEGRRAAKLYAQKRKGGQNRHKNKPVEDDAVVRTPAALLQESSSTRPENQNQNQNQILESESSLPSLASSLAGFKKSHGIGMGNGNGMGETSKGLRSGTGVTIEDPDERIRRFQAHLVPALGHHAWETIAAATDDSNPLHHEALARCRHAASLIGKGWPQNWPTHERY